MKNTKDITGRYSSNQYVDDFVKQFVVHTIPQGKTFFIISSHSSVISLKIHTQYDYIILIHVLEREKDIISYLQDVYKHIIPGGRLLIIYQNYLYNYLSGFGTSQNRLDNNWLSRAEMIQFLQLVDFEPIVDEALCFLRIYIPGISALCNRFLLFFFPFNHLSSLRYVLARKKSSSSIRSVSIIIPAKNEFGTIQKIFSQFPIIGCRCEMIFVEGHSRDGTREEIERCISYYRKKRKFSCKLVFQKGWGKANAVHLGIKHAKGDIIIIYDADMSVNPSDTIKFYHALIAGKGDLINGSRLVYPMEAGAMQRLNILGNKFFSLFFTFIFGQPLKDTLCGTKAFYRRDYMLFGGHDMGFLKKRDPFGDFYLLFGAKRLNLKIIDLPVRYHARSYGATNISRFKNAWELFYFSILSLRKLKMRL